jgi:hypothetical protein
MQDYRERAVTSEEFAALGPAGTVHMLEHDGFVFESRTCPIKLRSPCRMTPLPDGRGVRYEQWRE